MHLTPIPVGELLRGWRERRNLSQLQVSLAVSVSTRHLSCVETGRARPSPALILRLTEHLQVPLRERNEVLLAGGYAPAYPERPLDSDHLAPASAALRQILDTHDPLPALVLDRRWDVLDANSAAWAMLGSVAPHLLEPPVNVLRATLHPDGLAPRLVNLGQWRGHLLRHLDRRIELTAAETLVELRDEIRDYPAPTADLPDHLDSVVLPMIIGFGEHTLSLFSVTAVLTAGDITLDELTIETFYPADDATAGHFADVSASTSTSRHRSADI